MNRVLISCVAIAAVLLVVVAETEVDTVSDVRDSSNENNLTDVGESRKKHHHFFGHGDLFGLDGFGYGGLGPYGGLHSLAVLYAIKIKLLIVAAIIGLSVYYYAKIGKNYETVVPYSAYPQVPVGYSAQAPIYADPASIEYSSYPGPGADPYSGWSSEPQHYDHHDLSSLSHHAPGFEGEYLDRTGPSPSVQPDIYAPATPTSSGSASENIYRNKRQINTGILEDINWGEIAFQFLGVDTMGCRKRFVCELDFRSIRNPFTRVITAFIGKNFFDQYRDLSPDSPKPTHFEDCATMYRECAAAAAYNGPENDDVPEETEAAADVTETAEAEHDVTDAKEEEDDSSNAIARMINRGRLILLRADQ